MKISFVVPVYNCCSFLTNTLDSLLSQSHEEIEIIVVDDASTDDIVFLSLHYSDYSVIKWITNDVRRGAAFCRNLGNSIASGSIIACADAGDVFTENRASIIDDYFCSNKDVDLFYSDVQVSQATGEPLYIQPAAAWDGKSKPGISHPTLAYRKNVIQICRYHELSFDTDLYEFFLLDCYRRGFKFGFVNKVLCVKVDLTESENHRDIIAAKKLKIEKYKEYGINLPEGSL